MLNANMNIIRFNNQNPVDSNSFIYNNNNNLFNVNLINEMNNNNNNNNSSISQVVSPQNNISGNILNNSMSGNIMNNNYSISLYYKNLIKFYLIKFIEEKIPSTFQ